MGFSLVVTACEVGFTPDVEPLVIDEAGDQPFQDPSIQEAESVDEIDDEEPEPSSGFEGFTSADAIAICEEREYFGDENVGMCLAPGGESYYVWVARDTVFAVARYSAYFGAFAPAVAIRASELG